MSLPEWARPRTPTAGAGPGAGRGGHRRLASLALLLAAAGAAVPQLVASDAAATSVGTLRARAAAIARRIDTIQTKLQILSEEYDQAGTRAAALGTEVRAEDASLAAARRRVRADDQELRGQAIDAYVSAGSGGVLLSGRPDALSLQQTYLAAAAGNLATAVTSLRDAEHGLAVRRATLEASQRRARQAAATIVGARDRALRLEAQLKAAEAHVSGRLAAAVRAQEAAQRAAAAEAAAALARRAAAQPPVAPASPRAAAAGTETPARRARAAQRAPVAQRTTVAQNTTVAPSTTAPSSTPAPTGDAAAAIAAARSQLGVPYAWGGAMPGSGFDCSGLTMWAWGQAGVALPHSAQAQYDTIEHVALSDLQPGDLVFYASGGYIYHVVMYLGGGEAIQAETTGTTVAVTPLWPGAYGAGRP